MTNALQKIAVSHKSPMLPFWAEINEITSEAPGISTYWLRFLDEQIQSSYSFMPGQFNMLYMPGLGESAISISSNAGDKTKVGHTVRTAGNVTKAISRMSKGDLIGIRGPFGTYWPMDMLKGKDVVIAAGGIGLPPLRPVLYEVMENRQDYGQVILLYGARTPADLQFPSEYEAWEKADIDLSITVDRGDIDWKGQVGVVPMLFYRLRMDPKNTILLTCGPEIMIRFVVYEALARRIAPENIFVSMERNMKCGLGFCGHCQMGPYFVCKDGPVFSYDQLQPYFNVEEL
jgi:NAD(P)H-flavin reductase